jgi:hypothetical protein
MSSNKRKEKDTSQSPKPPRWKGGDSLELVYQLNERAFTLLIQSANYNRELWGHLDEQAIRRAARFPFLIVDVHFINEAWWRSVILNRQESLAAHSAGLWPQEVANKLLSEVLVFAWHTARWDRRVARLILGMVPGVVEVVRGLTPQQLDAVSGSHGAALRLRWQEDTEFWARLAKAAREGAGEALADIHLHAKLRLSGELMARRNAGKSPR